MKGHDLHSCRRAKRKKVTLNNNSNKLYLQRTPVNPDKFIALYKKLQHTTVTGTENKVIVTRLSTVYYWT